MTKNQSTEIDSSEMDRPLTGKRIRPVHKILEQLANAMTPEIAGQLLPEMTVADIKSALDYAVSNLTEHETQVNKESGTDLFDPTDDIYELDLDKILVVDDREDNRTLMEHMLTRNGFSPIFAANGSEALEVARTQLPALVVSDVMMPGMSGPELLQKLKADKRTRDIAVILVTAHRRDSKWVSQGLNMGAIDYIYRPFSIDEFVSRVRAAIRVKQTEAEKQRQAELVKQRNKGLNLVYELALAVNSSPDTRNIFVSSVQNLSHLLESDAVSLMLFDEEKQQLTVNIASQKQTYVSEVINAEVLSLDEVPKVMHEVINRHRDTLGMTLQLENHAIRYVPVNSRERQNVGAVVVVYKRTHEPNDADRILLHSAVNIIAIAIENAHLLEHAQQQVDDLIALNEIGRSLSSTLELNQTFEFTTQHVQHLINAELTVLWVMDEVDDELRLMVSSNGNEALKAAPYLDIYTAIANNVADSGEAYLSGNITEDRGYQCDAFHPATEKPCSVLCVPAKFEDKIIGVIMSVHSKSNRFNENHLRLSYPIANSIGIALKNTQLFGKVQEFNDYLEQMVKIRTQQLAEEKEKIETILANMADGLLVLDANNHILTGNTAAEKMLGFKFAELVGLPIEPGPIETSLWRSINNITRDTQPAVTVSVDVPSLQSDKNRTIEVHAAKVQGESGQMIGTVIVLRDVTVIKEVEQMKARFMAGVTHELKTPLAIIQLHINNLQTYYQRLPDEKKHELIHAVQNQVKILKQLVENILHLSRFDSGLVKTKLQPVELTGLVDQIVNDLRPLADEKSLSLTWQKPAQAITVMASSNQLERVIRNLIDNAIKYTPARKTITVGVFSEQTEKQTCAKIKVSDTGIGIAPEHQNNIFDRFYRVDPSHTIPGSGLGLSIVKEIVNLYKGTVELNSTPGAGSIFTVSLPIPGNLKPKTGA